jgi:hypothetical protein
MLTLWVGREEEAAAAETAALATSVMSAAVEALLRTAEDEFWAELWVPLL